MPTTLETLTGDAATISHPDTRPLPHHDGNGNIAYKFTQTVELGGASDDCSVETEYHIRPLIIDDEYALQIYITLSEAEIADHVKEYYDMAYEDMDEDDENWDPEDERDYPYTDRVEELQHNVGTFIIKLGKAVPKLEELAQQTEADSDNISVYQMFKNSAFQRLFEELRPIAQILKDAEHFDRIGKTRTFEMVKKLHALGQLTPEAFTQLITPPPKPTFRYL